ncbi:hypothetical protein ColTof4_12323 [Colletotrichum tofieldiae]|uniref:Uncharacterized protein n=1 Tax=Colletotrichum tofieldiae TaxID=708197 RepID=A0A166Y618_9PEZI|nr:hypothetical protein CT0861_02431 [Colletotrichum tofieldiae]GKT58392.1 hypothetical protein ColTof3_05731 [Colletotrichum tofieldiae]GKT79900.1 hypothetical protein ColTof4_12323 [Colletotrichum tofieldiae]
MISIIKLAMVTLAGTAVAGPLLEATTTKPGECTTTVTVLDAGFTGDYQPTATITLYNSTVTVAKPTDCHGCHHITSTTEIAPWWGGIGPQVEHVVWVHATTPTTVSTLVCATSTATPTDVPGPGPSK